MPIDKVKFPNGETEDIRDSRIPGIDSAPTANSANLVTSGGVKEALDGYLPLTGGTVNGALTVRGGRTWIGSNAGDGSAYENSHSIRWGYHGTDHMDFYEDVFNFYTNGGNTPTLYANGNTIWHQGNDGSDSGLDADLLDGRQGSDYVWREKHGYYDGTIPSILGTGFHEIVVQNVEYSSILAGRDEIGKEWQLYFHPHEAYTDEVYYLKPSKNLKRQFAFTDSNVASATNADTVDGKHASDFLTSHQTLYEANLVWGGRNLIQDFSPIDAAMIGALGANRGAFLNPSGVAVEYSRDAGSTWSDYGADDNSKRALFSGISVGLRIGKGEGGDTTNYQLRISLHSSVAEIYTTLNKFAILVSTEGSLGCHVQIRGRTQNNYANSIEQWDVFADSDISGWSGWNIINTQGITTYGNSPSYQYGEIQFIFTNTGYNGEGTYWGLNVLQIMMFGGFGWVTPSTMANKGTLYDWDANQNATFPAAVTANSLVSNGTVTGTGISPTWSDRWDSGGRYRPWYGLDIPTDTSGVVLSGYYGIHIRTSNNDIYIGGSGSYNSNIGIGINNPTRKLSVAGGIGAIGEESMFSNSTFTDPAVGIACGIKVSGGIASTGNTYLSTLSGNVGIGTTSPTEKLHVNGNILVDKPSSGGVLIGRDGNTIEGYYNGSLTDLFLNYASSHNVNLCFGGGNVGVGRTASSYKLDVNGDIRSISSAIIIQTSQPSGGMLPNRQYALGELSGDTTFSMAAGSSDVTNHYYWTFSTPSTAPTITWPAAITSWYGGSAPTINASKHYEVSVLDGVAICMEV